MLSETLIAARKHQQAGNLIIAAQLYRQVIQADPGQAAALRALAGMAYRQGRYEEACAWLRQALDRQEHDPILHSNLGAAYRAAGRLTEAEACYRQALRLKPDFAEGHNNLGNVLAALGNTGEAVAHYRQAVLIHPGYTEAHSNLGLALMSQGEAAEAATHFREAVRLQPARAERPLAQLRQAVRGRPDLAEVRCQLGLALADLGRLEEAEAPLREALELHPENVPALNHLGMLLEEMNRAAEGLALLQRAAALDPRDVETRIHLGMLLVNQGRFEEARAEFLQALTLKPDCGAAYFFLARDVKHAFTAAEVEHMEDLLRRESLPLRDRVNLHFALSRVYDRAKNFDHAFDHCDRGNTHKGEVLRRQGNAFDSAGHVRLVDRLIALFTPDYFARVQGFGSASDLPVFIVGMPRSGTSLVEQILASHPDVLGAGETRHIKRLLIDLPAALCSPTEYPECLQQLDRQTAGQLAERYVESLRRLGGDKGRVTDKQPMNFHHLGLIATLLPRAQIIHCRRDPRDVAWSCYFQNFNEIYFANDLRVLANYQRQYERLMAHWRKVLPVRLLEINYEELVADPERVSLELIAFCGLPWHDACLNFHQTQRVVRTSSNFQVRQPVYNGSVGYWKHYERHLQAVLEALG
jgi:Flp pilus assembly protein TadD